jgi:membrane-bound lytic murein transglycosylase D
MWLGRSGRTVVSMLLVGILTSAAAARAATPPPPKKAGSPAAKSAPAGGPDEENSSERRAVRGVALDEPGSGESPELRELRRFEERAFPRGGGAPIPDPGSIDDEAGDGRAAPPALRGHWGGTGDIPADLRSPDSSQKDGPAAATGAPDSEWLRSLKLPDLAVRWDPQVLRYLDYFRSDPKGRAVMTNWLRRAGRFRDLFEKTLERHGLPKDLFYVAMVESGFETAARSRVGAGGIWQFMPGAARAYGLEVSYWIDGRRDPERSVEAAARYLKDLYVRFGSWYLVFAAYNAGYGAVLTSITRYNTNDFWELCRHESGLPWESSIYVPKILAAAIVGHNLEAFGFADVTPDPPFVFDRVSAPAGTTFAAIARAAATKSEVIAALNAHLIRDRTPPDRGVVAVRVPVGTASLYAEALDRSRAAADRLDTVVLRFGETIDEVAKSRGLVPRELRRLNGVRDSAELRAGVTIVVPKRRVAAVAGAQDSEKRDPAERDPDAPEVAEDEPIIVAVPDRVFSYEGRERVFYRTRDGDSIDEIADTFAVRADDVIEWNSLDAGAKLQPRLVLQIFVRKDFDPASVVLLDSAKVRVVTLGSEEFLELETARRGKKRLFYTAKAGDTLNKVGRRYGLTAGDLARINRFSYNTELHDGQKIVVYSPTGEVPREVTMGMTPEPKRPATALPRTKGPALIAKGNAPSSRGADKPAAARATPVASARSTDKHGDARRSPAPSRDGGRRGDSGAAAGSTKKK